MKPATTNGELPRLGQELVGELVRAFKVRRLYNAGHPQRRGSEEASAARITGILEAEGSIDLTVESDSLLVGGEAVYEQDEGRESMAFLLHREGLRELSFFHGLTGEELGVFLDDVAAAALADSDREFDLVARLWERNFIHIRYTFVEHLMDEAWTPSDFQNGGEAAPRDESPIQLLEEDRSAADMLRQADPALYFLDDEDMAQLQQELEAEKERTLLQEALTCLREILLTPELDDDSAVLAAVIDIQAAHLVNGEYREIVLLHRIFEPCLAGERARAAAIPVFEALRERTLDPEVLEQAAVRVEGGLVKDTEVAEYYRAFGSGRIGRLLAHCGDLKRLCQRPAIAEAFVSLVREGTTELRGAIVDEDPVVACHAAYLAGLASQAALLEPLAKALKTDDTDVRREALSAIKQIGGQRALEIVVAAVEDEDPTVRLYALRHLVAHRYGPALARIASLIERSERRSLTERRLLYEAFGTLGGESVVEELGRKLRQRLSRRGLFRKSDPEEIGCLLIALGFTGSPRARDFLEEAAAAKHPLVQRTAFEVLQSIDSDTAVRE